MAKILHRCNININSLQQPIYTKTESQAHAVYQIWFLEFFIWAANLGEIKKVYLTTNDILEGFKRIIMR